MSKSKSDRDQDRDPHWFDLLDPLSELKPKPMRIRNTGFNNFFKKNQDEIKMQTCRGGRPLVHQNLINGTESDHSQVDLICLDGPFNKNGNVIIPCQCIYTDSLG